MGAHNFYDCATLLEQYVQYSANYIPNNAIPLDVLDLYKKEVMDIRKDVAFMGIWQIFQAANVLKCPIQSVFPSIGNVNVIKDLNRTVYCIDHGNNAKCAANIMWTPMQVTNSFHGFLDEFSAWSHELQWRCRILFPSVTGKVQNSWRIYMKFCKVGQF